MANFKTSSWYHLYVRGNKTNAFIGTALNANNHNGGAVFFEVANTTEWRQRWQLYAVNETSYVLRTREGGSDAFLAAMYSENESTPGKTVARMVRGNISDDSVFWQISPWGDGTFFLTNKQNGTEWHLARKVKEALVAMDSNITSTPEGQRWGFEEVAEIENNAYSTVDVSIWLRRAR
jgi:hypothetical protein